MTIKIGVLALQGDFAEHVVMLRRVGVETCEVRAPGDLVRVDGLVVPGGESTTIGKLLVRFGLLEPIRELGDSGMPIWGTCAGLILLAKTVGMEQPVLGVMDIQVDRNAFGRQIDSFETDLEVRDVPGGPLRAVFIRAPVVRTAGDSVDVLTQLEDGKIVAVRQGRLLGTSFHPELTPDVRMHELFLGMVKGA